MKKSIQDFIRFFHDESKDASFYFYLASKESDPHIKEKLKEIGKMEAEHAKFWRSLLSRHGITVKSKSTKSYNLFFYFLRRVLGIKWLSQFLEIGENSAIEKYYRIYTECDLDQPDKDALKKLIAEEILHEDFFKANMGNIQNNIRDIFLGMNDSLVEILAAVSGLTALSAVSTKLIGISGVIVGLSGTLSMAIGTYISVKNQKEVKNLGFLRLRVLAELFHKGKSPEQETEDPIRAALFTGLFYLVGTILIVVPFFFLSTAQYALATSVMAASVAWIISGTVIALSSGLSIHRKIAEMILTGYAATLITFTLGSLLSGHGM